MNTQQEMPWLAEVPDPQPLPESIIERIESEAQAVALCWSRRSVPYTQQEAADKLRINRGVFTLILNGTRAVPPGKRILFQRLCGNWAITQYEMHEAGMNSHPKRRASDFGGRRGQFMERRNQERRSA